MTIKKKEKKENKHNNWAVKLFYDFNPSRTCKKGEKQQPSTGA